MIHISFVNSFFEKNFLDFCNTSPKMQGGQSDSIEKHDIQTSKAPKSKSTNELVSALFFLPKTRSY